jgi:hypothetical protein
MGTSLFGSNTTFLIVIVGLLLAFGSIFSGADIISF